MVNNPPVATNDAATYSAGGGTCDNLQVSFNPSISISQGGYRFFENDDSTVPGSPLAFSNTPVFFTQLNKKFRLRLLLDVDSPSGTTLGIDSGDWELMYSELPGSGDCADGIYSPVDIEGNGTPIAYSTNPNSGGNNSFITFTGNDPNDSSYTEVEENYIETWLDDGSENITNHQNTLGNNQAGLFDFSLVDQTDGVTSKTYCIIVTNGDGSLLDSYKNYPQVTTPQTDVLIQGGATITGGSSIE